jgi:rSAM/selenodomain-associated transferase 1
MIEPAGPTPVTLMVRVPVPGQVKTRLAAAIGDAAACTLYRAMVGDILADVLASGLPLVLFHDGKEAAALPKQWTQAASRICPQVEGDIGQRMAAAFGHCFDEGFARVILIGSDLPDLDVGVLAIAAVALENHDAVIAPTLDGGYGLIGLQQASFRPELFLGIAWSTDQVLSQTLRPLQRFGLSTSLLAPLRDIDDLADLQAWHRDPSRRPTAFPQAVEDLRRAGRLPDPAANPCQPLHLENPS